MVKKLPLGCDQQGRYPEAAEAATDIGADDPPEQDMFWVVMNDVLLSVAIVAALFALGWALAWAWGRV
jgi:hypothetical protein